MSWAEAFNEGMEILNTALLVEQLGYAPDEQLLYLAICPNELSFKRALQLRKSFVGHQQFGRIPDLVSGEEICAILPSMAKQGIGLWLQRIKNAEIAGEIDGREAAVRYLEAQK